MKCLNCKTETINPKFCDRSCAAQYNNVKYPKRHREIQYCAGCGVELRRKGKYCSNKCQGIHIRADIIAKIENGSTIEPERQYRRYLIEKFGAKCMLCGWAKENPVTKTVMIEMDHIDGNSDNNSLTNLRLICPNCSSLTPTYKALNKGSGRWKRRERYSLGKSY